MRTKFKTSFDSLPKKIFARKYRIRRHFCALVGLRQFVRGELADCNGRKRNFIVYNLAESSGSPNKSDLQPCVPLCLIVRLLLLNQY